MASHLAVPVSPERTLKRQPSAPRITVSTVRPAKQEPVATSIEPSEKAAPIRVAPFSQDKATKKRKLGGKPRARRHGANFSEGEDEDEEEEDEDEEDDAGSELDSEEDGKEGEDDVDDVASDVSSASDEERSSATDQAKAALPAPPPLITPDTSDEVEGKQRPSDAPSSGTGTSTSTGTGTGSKLSWAAIAEEDDDSREMEAFEEEIVAEAAAAAAARAKAAGAAPAAATKSAPPSKTAATAALSAKEKKKLKDKERKLRKKAELAAAAAAVAPDSAAKDATSSGPASKTQAKKTQAGQPPREERPAAGPKPVANPKDAQDNYRDRLTKDPTYTPRLGNFWGHDERLIDGDLRKLSGWWRGRGGHSGGSVGGRGGHTSARSDARAGSSDEPPKDAPLPHVQEEATTSDQRIPPHLRPLSGRGGRGGAALSTRGGRGGGRIGQYPRALGAGSFGAYGPGPAPPGRSKLRGWDDDEDFDDSTSASDVPKVDFDALEGKAVREPSRAARPPPAAAASTRPWTTDAPGKARRGDGAAGPAKDPKLSLAGVPTAPRAMREAAQAAEAGASTESSTAPAASPAPLPDCVRQPRTGTEEPQADGASKWRHDGFAELQRVEATRGSKRGARGGASASAGRGGGAAGAKSDRKPAALRTEASAPAGQVTSPGGSLPSPHRAGVPLDGRDGVFVTQSASRSNSIAGRDSPVVFGSVHGSETEHERAKSAKFEPKPRAASFALASATGSQHSGASGVPVRLPNQEQSVQRPPPPQQTASTGSVSVSHAPYPSYGAYGYPDPRHISPSHVSPAHSVANSGTPPPFAMAPPLPVTMAPSLPPGFAVDSTGMVFNLTGGQPVAVGYLSPMGAGSPAPAGGYYGGPVYAEDIYAHSSPANSTYQPTYIDSPAPAPQAPLQNRPREEPAPPQVRDVSSGSAVKTSPVQEKREARSALPPHMQQPGSTRASVLGKHARTLSTLPASAATVPAFRPSAPTSSAAPSNAYTRQAGAGYSHQQPSQAAASNDQGQAILEHAMSQVRLAEGQGQSGYGLSGESGGSPSPYGLDAYASQISPPLGTVYFQPPPPSVPSGAAYGADPYGAQQGYGSPAYYGAPEMYDGSQAFFAAAYDHQ
ncbi:hypothetical protein V8E36_000835 [Tilletia maclaganii]